jgi:hypothetical protein
VVDHASNPEAEWARSQLGNILRAEIRELRPALRAVYEIQPLTRIQRNGRLDRYIPFGRESTGAPRKIGGDGSLPHNVGTVRRRRLSQE